MDTVEAELVIDAKALLGEGPAWWGYRYNPDTGEKLDTLYITSASVGLSEEELEAQPLAGGLLKYKTQTPDWPTDEITD